jgi:hypothetical protein
MFIHRVLGLPTAMVSKIDERCAGCKALSASPNAFLSVPIRPGSFLNNDERFFDDPRDITQENAVNTNLS